MIYFKIERGQELVRVDHDVVAADTTDLMAHFDLGELFTGAITTFWRSEAMQQPISVVLNSSKECLVPYEVLAKVDNKYGVFDHYVFVSIADSGMTTSSTCTIKVQLSQYSNDPENPGEPTPTIIEQLTELVGSANDYTDEKVGEVSEEVYQLSESIDEIENGLELFIDYGKNRLDASKSIQNMTMNSQGDPLADSSNTLSLSDFCYVGDLTSFRMGYFYLGFGLYGVNSYYCEYDKNKNKIGVRKSGGKTETSLSSGTEYIRIVFTTSYIDTFMLVKGDEIVSEMIPYRDPIKDFKVLESIPKRYTVGKKSNTDFTEILPAVIEATKYLDSVIYVYSGDYDIIQEFENYYGDDFFSNYSSQSVKGIILKNRVSIIFSPNANVICDYTGNNPTVMEYFAPFNSGELGFYLEGLNIHASSVRYCFHDDPVSTEIPMHNTFKNCRMVLDNRNNTAWGARQCIGGGMNISSDIDIDSCYFEGYGGSGDGYLVSYHNNSNVNAYGNISIKNCFIADGANRQKNTIKVSYFGTSTKITKAFVSNNSVGYAPVCIPENSSATIQNMQLFAWNNEIRN